jgi:hypothetical protein
MSPLSHSVKYNMNSRANYVVTCTIVFIADNNAPSISCDVRSISIASFSSSVDLYRNLKTFILLYETP